MGLGTGVGGKVEGEMQADDDVYEDSPETEVAGADMFGPFSTLAGGDSLEEPLEEPDLLSPDLALGLEGVEGGVIPLAGVLWPATLAGGATSLGGDLDLEADTTLTSLAGGHGSMSGEGDNGESSSWQEEGTALLGILCKTNGYNT